MEHGAVECGGKRPRFLLGRSHCCAGLADTMLACRLPMAVCSFPGTPFFVVQPAAYGQVCRVLDIGRRIQECLDHYLHSRIRLSVFDPAKVLQEPV